MKVFITKSTLMALLILVLGDLSLLVYCDNKLDATTLTVAVMLILLVIGVVALLSRVGSKKIRVLTVVSILALSQIYPLMAMWLHSESLASSKTDWRLTQRRLDHISELITDYKNEFGQCPESLAVILPRRPDYLDYFARLQPLKYKTEGDRCIVYSIGIDRVDDEAKQVLKNDAIARDMPSSCLSFSLIAPIYKAKFLPSTPSGDLVRIVRVE